MGSIPLTMRLLRHSSDSISSMLVLMLIVASIQQKYVAHSLDVSEIGGCSCSVKCEQYREVGRCIRCCTSFVRRRSISPEEYPPQTLLPEAHRISVAANQEIKQSKRTAVERLNRKDPKAQWHQLALQKDQNLSKLLGIGNESRSIHYRNLSRTRRHAGMAKRWRRYLAIISPVFRN